MDKLISGEEILRGYLGVRIQPVDDDMAEALGIERNRGEFIQLVSPGEPAEDAGLEVGDVVLKVDGQDVTRDNTLSYIVANIAPGTTVPIRILRDGREQTLRATIGRRPSEEELRQQQMFSGNDDEDASPHGAQPGRRTAGRAAWHPGSAGDPDDRTPAWRSERYPRALPSRSWLPIRTRRAKAFRAGSSSSRQNGTPVAQVADLEAILAEARDSNRGAVLLRAQARGGQPQSVAVRLMEE